jgi:hypothetical protein
MYTHTRAAAQPSKVVLTTCGNVHPYKTHIHLHIHMQIHINTTHTRCCHTCVRRVHSPRLKELLDSLTSLSIGEHATERVLLSLFCKITCDIHKHAEQDVLIFLLSSSCWCAQVLAMVSAVLHLGNVTFDAERDKVSSSLYSRVVSLTAQHKHSDLVTIWCFVHTVHPHAHIRPIAVSPVIPIFLHQPQLD